MPKQTTTLSPFAEPRTTDVVTGEPVLITEQEVLFGSTAAVSLPRRTASRRLTDAISGFFSYRRRPPRPSYPRHYSFLENALMAREMDRL